MAGTWVPGRKMESIPAFPGRDVGCTIHLTSVVRHSGASQRVMEKLAAVSLQISV